MMGGYGSQVEGSEWRPLRSVIGQVETTGSGNIVLRVGRELARDSGWEQTEHVVLTPAEAAALIDELRSALRVPIL